MRKEAQNETEALEILSQYGFAPAEYDVFYNPEKGTKDFLSHDLLSEEECELTKTPEENNCVIVEVPLFGKSLKPSICLTDNPADFIDFIKQEGSENIYDASDPKGLQIGLVSYKDAPNGMCSILRTKLSFIRKHPEHYPTIKAHRRTLDGKMV
jgi:hypothetical protein